MSEKSRIEEIMEAILSGKTENLPEPQSRMEAYLHGLADKMKNIPSTDEITLLKNELSSLSKKISELEESGGSGESVDISELENRVDILSEQLDGLGSRFNEFNDNIDGRLMPISDDISYLTGRIEGLTDTTSDLDRRLTALEGGV